MAFCHTLLSRLKRPIPTMCFAHTFPVTQTECARLRLFRRICPTPHSVIGIDSIVRPLPARLLSLSSCDSCDTVETPATNVLDPIHVFLFITIVGWGKNTLMETITGQEEMRKAAFGDENPIILESDILGQNQFWTEVVVHDRCCSQYR